MAPTKAQAKHKAATATNDFQSFVTNARERKRNEDLATKIFSTKSRRQSAPSTLKSQKTPGGSLASRVGVKKKPRASLGSRAAPAPAGNVNGEWTHDLHNTVNNARSLKSRITNGSANAKAPPTGPRGNKAARRATALDRMDLDSAAVQSQANIRSPPQGISIRGLAGPFTVMGQNFAPGTTAADVESAMTPIGGPMEQCRVIKTQPFMVVEMVFASREGGERVIETFNDKTADGRKLKMYPKIGGGEASTTATRASRAEEQVVDGSHGFPDPKQTQRLYSDKIVSHPAGRGRGRGQRGRVGE
ncbi:putative RNA-binding protein-like protein [Emericellopsis cladophorae]|uniref:RNA-binding protein-like protein n=1 Tax=Emericellopsis cladophorae TaxID=2686198 RepID=A0A9P9XXB0_9HYPO|nr:putative RNA-binding protein-like protein [Emericellopsis cladophorae]KAI6779548.1 putative RNA-binding protein-like protein [Emericellopsis cladophorae]